MANLKTNGPISYKKEFQQVTSGENSDLMFPGDSLEAAQDFKYNVLARRGAAGQLKNHRGQFPRKIDMNRK